MLGNARSESAPYIITEIDPRTGALFARSMLGGEFAGRIAFTDLAGTHTSWTGDRTEFLGRNGTFDCPLALEKGGELSGKSERVSTLVRPFNCRLSWKQANAPRSAGFLVRQRREQAQLLINRYRKADVDTLLRR